MLRHCSSVDWKKNDITDIMHRGLNKNPCGVIYDDDEKSTVCPHEKKPSKSIKAKNIS